MSSASHATVQMCGPRAGRGTHNAHAADDESCWSRCICSILPLCPSPQLPHPQLIQRSGRRAGWQARAGEERSLFRVVAAQITLALSVPSQDHCWEPTLLARRIAVFLSPQPICTSSRKPCPLGCISDSITAPSSMPSPTSGGGRHACGVAASILP